MHYLLSLTRVIKVTSYTTTSDSYQVTPLLLQPLNHDYIPQKAAQVLSTRTDEPWPPPGGGAQDCILSLHSPFLNTSPAVPTGCDQFAVTYSDH